MSLGHPGWREKSGWSKPKKVGDVVAGPVGGAPYGVGTVTHVHDTGDSEAWVTAEFEEENVILVAPSGNFYLLESLLDD